MSMESSRADKSHEISYPTSADKRGSTRVNYRRRPYYLGPHDSPASYIMFGLWKHRLLETGEAPSTKELRPIVQSLLSQQSTAVPAAHRSWQRLAAAAIAGAAVLSLVLICTAKILSSDPLPKVDDVVLSEIETEFIRGYRAQNLGLWQDASDQSASIAALTAKFMEEGTANGLRHISGKNF